MITPAPTLAAVWLSTIKRPSPIFVLLIVAAGASAAVAWNDDLRGGRTYAVFAFVLLGWIISLCLHEFAHARTAFAAECRPLDDKYPLLAP